MVRPVLPPITNLRQSKIFWAAVLLLAATAAWPLLSQAGLLNTRGGGDSPFLLQRLHQLMTALADGHFPVRWMPDANYGYGYPFYNFYAPLSIYIAALFRFLGFSFVGAIKAAQFAGFLVAGAGTFFLGRRWFNNNCAGLLAAAAYTFAPFHMVNIYVRGDSLAEFWAMAFYPLLLLTADNLVHQPKRPLNIALFALTYAALILSHNISALIFTPFLFLYLTLTLLSGSKKVFRNRVSSKAPSRPWNDSEKPSFYLHQGVDKEQRRPSQPTQPQTIIFIILALLLALALSAWFWLPALSEQDLAQLEPVTAGYFHFSNHFRGGDLIQNSLLFNYDVAQGGAFRMGLVQLITIILGLGVIWLKVIKKHKTRFLPAFSITASFLIATFMITPLSRPLWDNLPLLPFTQFPWRFLSVQALFGAIAVGGLALLPKHKLIVPLLIVGIAVSGLGDLRTDHLYLTDADVTAERLAEYEWFTGNIGSTVSAEYLPPEVQPRPFTSQWLNTNNRSAVIQLDSVVETQPLLQATTRKSWLTSTAAPTATIALPVTTWPGWEATIDRSPVAIETTASSGLISVVVPNGEHTVSIQLRRTPIRGTAELISIAALLMTAILFWPTARTLNGRTHLKKAATIAVALLALTIALRLWPSPSTSPNTLSWDFEQLGYLYHSPDGIPFEDDLLLRHYTYNKETIGPQEELTITLNWENGEGRLTDIALITPALQRIETAPILVSHSQTVEGGQAIYRLPIPENAPAGLYVPRITVDGVKATTNSGQRRGDLFLRPIRILDGFQAAGRNQPLLNVQAVDVSYQAPDLLLVQLQWLTLNALPANYNLSLRLIDNNGLLIAQQDAQPGFGFLPSSGWLPGRWEDDWLTLPLPETFTAEQAQSPPYALVTRLYDVQTNQVILTRHLGQMTWQDNALAFQETVPTFERPEGLTPTIATFENLIQLEGYTLQETADSLNLTLYWQALANGQEEFFHFVHLVDSETGQIVAQHDSMPRNNTYPTSQWVNNEIVSDNLQLNLKDVGPGEYLLYVGLYRNLENTSPPLMAVDGMGWPLENNRLFLEKIVISNQ